MNLTIWDGRGIDGDIQAGMREALIKLPKGDGLVYFQGKSLPEGSKAGAAALALGNSRLATLVQKQLGPASDKRRTAYYILQRK